MSPTSDDSAKSKEEKALAMRHSKDRGVAAGKDGESSDDDVEEVYTPENDRLLMITEAGGIVPLVSLLTTGGMAAKEHAAAALILAVSAVKHGDGLGELARADQVAAKICLGLACDEIEHREPLAEQPRDRARHRGRVHDEEDREPRRNVVEDGAEGRHAQAGPQENHSKVERCARERFDVRDDALVWVVDRLQEPGLSCTAPPCSWLSCELRRKYALRWQKYR